MAYVTQWVNQRDSLSGAELTLLLVDKEGVYPDLRIEKSFQGVPLEKIGDEFLDQAAKVEIALAIQAQRQAEANTAADSIRDAKMQAILDAAAEQVESEVQSELAAIGMDAKSVDAQIQADWAVNAVADVLMPPILIEPPILIDPPILAEPPILIDPIVIDPVKDDGGAVLGAADTTVDVILESM